MFPSLAENTALETLLFENGNEAHVGAAASQMLDICRALPVSIQQVRMVVDGAIQSLFHSQNKDVWQRIDDILGSPSLRRLWRFGIITRKDSDPDCSDVESTLHEFAAKTCKRGIVRWKSDVFDRST